MPAEALNYQTLPTDLSAIGVTQQAPIVGPSVINQRAAQTQGQQQLNRDAAMKNQEAEQKQYETLAINRLRQSTTNPETGEWDYNEFNKRLSQVPGMSSTTADSFGKRIGAMDFVDKLPDDNEYKEFYRGLLKNGDFDNAMKLMTIQNGSGSETNLDKKTVMWDKVQAMPESTLQEINAKKNALTRYWSITSPSIGYDVSGQRQEVEFNRLSYLEDRLREGKVKTAGDIAAKGTESRILTESELAEISAKTAGTIEGGKEVGKREAGVTLSEVASRGLGDFSASQAQMRELLIGINNPDTPQGPVSQWRKANPYDWKAQGKQQLVASTKQLVGKALEGGVLRKEDEEKYNKILPTMGDTFESAVVKSDQLVTMLDNAYKATLESYRKSGYDVSKYSATSTTPKPTGHGVGSGLRARWYNPETDSLEYITPTGE